MRFSITSTVAVAIFAISPAAVRAQDVVIDGKPCNAFCQSWLGVRTKPAVDVDHQVTASIGDHATAPAAAVPATPSARPVRPAPLIAAEPDTRQGYGASPMEGATTARLTSVPTEAETDGAVDRYADAPLRTGRAAGAARARGAFAELPKSSDLVAVPGVIMIESARDRADRERIYARMQIATRRPKVESGAAPVALDTSSLPSERAAALPR